MNRRISLLTVAIVAIIGSVLVASATFTAAANAGSDKTATYVGMRAGGGAIPMHRGFAPTHLRQGWSGNVTIDAEQAKALVEESISNFKVGTIFPLRLGWTVPIEDEKGVVTSIGVTKVSASTAEQAKGIVEESLGKGWKAGEPRLVRTIYVVPLLDSNEATISYVSVDGRSGEIIRRPSTILTVTSEQAKTIVSDAVKEFKVGEVKERRSVWIVSIKYNDKVVMTVLLGKLNTPTSEDALNTVQQSLEKGWSAGEPKQLRLIYNVPIIDANGNTVGNIVVDGRTGNIAGFPPIPTTIQVATPQRQV